MQCKHIQRWPLFQPLPARAESSRPCREKVNDLTAAAGLVTIPIGKQGQHCLNLENRAEALKTWLQHLRHKGLRKWYKMTAVNDVYKISKTNFS